MSKLEERLTGERASGYASSGDERSDEEEDNEGPGAGGISDPAYPGSNMATSKTGPKGVIEDYKRYKELEDAERVQNEKRKIEFVKKSALTCRSTREDEDHDELATLEDDDFLRKYHEMRLKQMKKEAEQSITSQRARFGKVIPVSGLDFVTAIDKEDPSVTVIIHLYENNVPACVRMNRCLDCLAQQYPQIKFCRAVASQTGLSLEFKLNALPTLQVYKDGVLLGNYLKLAEELDEEFYAADVENFLLEHGILSSTPMSGISKPIRGLQGSGQSLDSSDDSDPGLD